MRLATTSTGIGLLLTLTFAPVYAGQKGHSPKAKTTHAPAPKTTHAPAPKTTHARATTHGPSAKSVAAKPVKGPSSKPVTTTRIAKADAKSARVTAKVVRVDAKAARVDAKSARVNAKAARVDAKSAKVDAKLAKADAKAAKTKKTTVATTELSTSKKRTTTPTSGTTTVNFTSGTLGTKLTKNSALRSKLESRLTALGYDGTVYQAAYGFKNLGQFVAATNVSKNLGIPFEQLKVLMTGLSVAPDGTVLRASVGPDGKVTMVDPALVVDPASMKTLGQSIQTLKTNVDAIGAAQTASMQADAEIQRTSTVAAR